MPDMLPANSETNLNPGNSTIQSYNEVPYDSHPFLQTHPSRLFTVGTLFGLRPTNVAKARVLELGCSLGGNIIPMADALPDAEFIGIDYSNVQIEEGQKNLDKMGLKNCKLKCASITDIDESYGLFDYIICHGVYSWVPQNVQEAIFDVCNKHLTPNGIAYVSYNTFPGWHMRGMIRDMMIYHSSRFNKPELRIQQARALLDFLAQSVKQDGGAYSLLLKQELETIRHQANYYLYHEHLEEHNYPVYFHQIAERAIAKGLKYLGEARIGTMVTANFGPEIEKTLRILATDQIQAEQYMDFLRNRMFRESLFVKNNIMPNWAIQPENLRVLHVASNARPVDAQGQLVPRDKQDLTQGVNVSFKTASGMSMATDKALLKSMMQVLNDNFPCTVQFDLLRKTARERIGGGDATDPKIIQEDTTLMAMGILNCYMSSDLIELHGIPLQFPRKVEGNPTVYHWARIQSTGKGTVITNRRHEVIRMNDLDKHLIPLLDGVNTKDDVVAKLSQVALTGGLNVQKDGITLQDPEMVKQAITSIIDQALQNVANNALLAG